MENQKPMSLEMIKKITLFKKETWQIISISNVSAQQKYETEYFVVVHKLNKNNDQFNVHVRKF